MKKARPVASKLRLLAEQAWVDVTQNGAKARRHAETLQFLAMAARRLDYLGMKIQFTNEIGELYREMQADPPDNVLASYDRETIRWVDRIRFFEEITQQYWATKAVPDLASSGIFLP